MYKRLILLGALFLSSCSSAYVNLSENSSGLYKNVYLVKEKEDKNQNLAQKFDASQASEKNMSFKLMLREDLLEQLSPESGKSEDNIIKVLTDLQDECIKLRGQLDHIQSSNNQTTTHSGFEPSISTNINEISDYSIQQKRYPAKLD